jgi:SAM-dependent methyltransferase
MTVDREREFWEGRAAHSEVTAIEAIGADPSMWDGAQLESDLARIFRAFELAMQSGTSARTVLDLGCGIGRVAIPLAERLMVRSDRPWEVVGVDISAAMLRHAAVRDRVPAVRAWLECDGRKIPLGRFHPELAWGYYGLALTYSLLTLQHMPRDAAADYIKQIGKQTSPGGAFLFQTLEGTAGDFLWNEMTEDFARESCAAAGLEVVEVERVKVNTADKATSIWVTAVKRV